MNKIILLSLLLLASCSSEKSALPSSLDPAKKELTQAELLQQENQRQQSIEDNAISEANKLHNPILICREEGMDTRYIFSRKNNGSLKALVYKDKVTTQKLSEITYVCQQYSGSIASVVSFPVSFLETGSDELYESRVEDCRYGDITREPNGPIIGHSGKKSAWRLELDADNSKARVLSKEVYYKVIDGIEEKTLVHRDERNLYNCKDI